MASQSHSLSQRGSYSGRGAENRDSTICPETVAETIDFNFWDVKITLRRQKVILGTDITQIPREEHSMDQYRSRLKLSENFEHHWSILISGEFMYGPIIGPYLFLGKFIWTNGPESSSKVPPYTGTIRQKIITIKIIFSINPVR